MGILYIVGTPIGNLEDISLRALRILSEVDLIAAEDTRRTRKMLAHYDIKAPLTSYHEHNKLAKLDFLLNTLREKDVALVSEAGMPGLSDPGYELVRAAIEAHISIVPIPGPSALVTALVVSGLPTDSFLYLGFLPRREAKRRQLLNLIAEEGRTMVIFEAPHRLLASLHDIREVLGNRQIAVARELTKAFEEVIRGNLEEVIQHFSETRPRGEFTLVIEGAKDIAWEEEQVKEELEKLLAGGVEDKEAIKQVAKSAGWPRREVYEIWLVMKP